VPTLYAPAREKAQAPGGSMQAEHFFHVSFLVCACAFCIAETAVTIVFIFVYARMAVRHILTLGQKAK
jgi:hypothetical protein